MIRFDTILVNPEHVLYVLVQTSAMDIDTPREGTTYTYLVMSDGAHVKVSHSLDEAHDLLHPLSKWFANERDEDGTMGTYKRVPR